MNRPDVTEHNVETGEFLVRPMTDKEFEGYQLAQQEAAERALAAQVAESEAATKATKRAAILAAIADAAGLDPGEVEEALG